MSDSYRNAWTSEEDFALVSLVEKHGTNNWKLIAKKMISEFSITRRTGKQSRERWYNHLSPNVDKKPWTQEEDDLIFELYKAHGKSWKTISDKMPGRTDNSIKNRFYSSLRRKLRKFNKTRPKKEKLVGPVRTLLRNPNVPLIIMNEYAPSRNAISNNMHYQNNQDEDIKVNEVEKNNDEELIEAKQICEDVENHQDQVPEKKIDDKVDCKTNDEGSPNHFSYHFQYEDYSRLLSQYRMNMDYFYLLFYSQFSNSQSTLPSPFSYPPIQHPSNFK